MKSIRSRRAWFISLLALMLALPGAGLLIAQTSPNAAAQPGGMTTVAVIAVAPYEKLISNVNMLGAMVGRPESGQMVDGMFTFFTQGKGPASLDKKKPWGVIVQTDGTEFLPIGCLPVAKPQDLLEVAAAFGAQVRDAEHNTRELQLPNDKSLYLKQEGEWTFLSMSPESLTRLPARPEAELAGLVADYQLAVRISMKDVPEMYRDFAVQAMQSGMQQQVEQREDETDEQYELRQKMTETQMAQAMRTLEETDSITIGWAVDPIQQNSYIDFTQQFLAGSKMAQQITAYGSPRTNFAGFFKPDAAVTMTFVTKADPAAIKQDIANFEATMQTVRAGFNNGIDESDAEHAEELKAAFADWFDAMEATIRAGQLDGGAALDASNDSLTIIAGATVKDTAKIESGLKKLEATAAAKQQGFAGIQWNAATHAGVRFHTMSVPIPADQESPRRLLGSEANIALGIGEDKVFVAIGRDHLNAVKQAIDASAAEPNKEVPTFEMAMSLGPIMELAASQAEDGDQKQMAQAVADMLRNEAQGRDHIRVVGQVIPNGLRYRLTAEEGALKAIGVAANEAQRRALQANQ